MAADPIEQQRADLRERLQPVNDDRQAGAAVIDAVLPVLERPGDLYRWATDA